MAPSAGRCSRSTIMVSYRFVRIFTTCMMSQTEDRWELDALQWRKDLYHSLRSFWVSSAKLIFSAFSGFTDLLRGKGSKIFHTVEQAFSWLLILKVTTVLWACSLWAKKQLKPACFQGREPWAWPQFQQFQTDLVFQAFYSLLKKSNTKMWFLNYKQKRVFVFMCSLVPVFLYYSIFKIWLSLVIKVTSWSIG